MKTVENKRKAVENYIKSYNDFDVENMLKDLGEHVIFRNIVGGTVNLEIKGIAEFQAQAVQAVDFFEQREQKVVALNYSENHVEAEISYSGIVAVDLPNGLKAGDKIGLAGKSKFYFANDKIVMIEDFS